MIKRLFITSICSLVAMPIFAKEKALNLIPYPNNVRLQSSTDKFIIDRDVSIKNDENNLNFCAEFLSTKLNISQKIQNKTKIINLKIDKSFTKKNSYKLTIGKNSINIIGSDDAGVFYGIQTLLQMLQIDKSGSFKKELPLISVEDAPRFEFRSFMLDSSRHFQKISKIKELLDNLASLKMNYFHWHLVDDQGWRFEVKKYPKLTQIGGFLAKDHKMERAGFYTQEELREVVNYAKKRNIIIIPEIDVPGHSKALLKSIPELLCDVAKNEEDTGSTICVTKEKTYQVLDDIFKELIDVFEPPYVHIGGDEVAGDIWNKCSSCSSKIKRNNFKKTFKLEKIFLDNVAQIIKKHGSRAIVWGEHLDKGGIPKDSHIQGWRCSWGGKRQDFVAAKASIEGNFKVINSLGDYAYFDYRNHPGGSKPSWVPVLPLERVYKFPVIPVGLTDAQAKNIIGGECTMWTEYVISEDINKMIFPRILAFAEQMWSNENIKDYDSFLNRLAVIKQFYERQGVEFAKPHKVVDIKQKTAAKITTSMGIYKTYVPEYMLDSNDVTWYVSKKIPEIGDYFTVEFDHYKNLSSLSIYADFEYMHDFAKAKQYDKFGIVKISADGVNFKQIGRFEDGVFEMTFPTKEKVKAIKVIVTEKQQSNMVISEVNFTE
ncbi:beta-N-acetylhexosaminidase [Lentisphaerota bacterium WC36G]|nr:beta-N-acetylhexosaminidase [Lentisphaerae bacterium WC36]